MPNQKPIKAGRNAHLPFAADCSMAGTIRLQIESGQCTLYAGLKVVLQKKDAGSSARRSDEGNHKSPNDCFHPIGLSINSSIAFSTGTVYCSPPKSHCSCCISNSRISGSLKYFLYRLRYFSPILFA